MEWGLVNNTSDIPTGDLSPMPPRIMGVPAVSPNAVHHIYVDAAGNLLRVCPLRRLRQFCELDEMLYANANSLHGCRRLSTWLAAP